MPENQTDQTDQTDQTGEKAATSETGAPGAQPQRTAHPCRLFGMLARETPVAVLLRRGPSRWVRMIRWDTEADTFELGQWFRARVYERRCALSPDGELFVYFANKTSARTIRDKEYTYAWTAVSRPPYFTALALWPKGDCWNGGGVFQDNTTLLLNHPFAQAQRDHPPEGLHVLAGREIPWFTYGEDMPVFSAILASGGWSETRDERVVTETVIGRRAFHYRTWRKPHPAGGYELELMERGWDRSKYGSPHIVEYAVYDESAQDVAPLEGAEWAEWDARGRLVFARDGRLYATEPAAFLHDIASAHILADFNDQQPERMAPPAWAEAWPKRPKESRRATKRHRRARA